MDELRRFFQIFAIHFCNNLLQNIFETLVLSFLSLLYISKNYCMVLILSNHIKYVSVSPPLISLLYTDIMLYYICYNVYVLYMRKGKRERRKLNLFAHFILKDFLGRKVKWVWHIMKYAYKNLNFVSFMLRVALIKIYFCFLNNFRRNFN